LNASVPAARASEVIAQLKALADELAVLGWSARLQAQGGWPPSLYVRNPVPGAAALSEHIYVRQRRADGIWVYMWPWADSIAANAADAAAAIVHALRPARVSLTGSDKPGSR
jgi:hypothetical protein